MQSERLKISAMKNGTAHIYHVTPKLRRKAETPSDAFLSKSRYALAPLTRFRITLIRGFILCGLRGIILRRSPRRPINRSALTTREFRSPTRNSGESEFSEWHPAAASARARSRSRLSDTLANLPDEKKTRALSSSVV